MPEPQPLQPGDPQTLGQYRLVGRLGEGAQGVVFVAEGPDGGNVAIKLLNARLGQPGGNADRFLREVSAARRVAQFCTAQVLGASMNGERPYIVSELVDGVSLQRVVRERGPRTGGALYRLAVGTVTALAAIHRAGIVHRDFKPSNVLLGSDGPRVIDFGIARALDSAMTLSSGVVGTPAYMSPEQVAGERVGPPTDMFAWALTMTFAATGTPAFGQDSLPAVIYRVINEEPDLATFPDSLRPVVTACLSKRADSRPTAAETLFTLLEDQPEDDFAVVGEPPYSSGGGEPAVPVGGLERSLAEGAHTASNESITVQARIRPPAQPSPPQAPPPQMPAQGATPQGPVPQGPVPQGPTAQLAREAADLGADPHFAEGIAEPDAEDRSGGGKRVGLVTGVLVAALALAATALFVVPAVFGNRTGAVAVPTITSSAMAAHSASPTASPQPPASPSLSPSPSPKPKLDLAKPLKGHTKLVYSLAGGERGGHPVALSAGGDGSIRVWNVGKLRNEKTLRAGGAAVYAVATVKMGSTYTAVSGGYDHTVRVWNLKTGKARTLGAHGNAVYAVAAGKAGKKWVAASGDGNGFLKIWNIKSGKLITSIRAHQRAILWLAYGKVGGRSVVVSASQDGTVRIWDLSSHKKKRTYKGHKSAVFAVATGNLDGRDVVVSGGQDRTIRIWDARTGKTLGKLTGHKKKIYSLALGEVGGRPILVSGSTDGTIRLWDPVTHKSLIKPIKADKSGVYAVGIVTVDGKTMILSAGKSRSVKIWRLDLPMSAS